MENILIGICIILFLLILVIVAHFSSKYNKSVDEITSLTKEKKELKNDCRILESKLDKYKPIQDVQAAADAILQEANAKRNFIIKEASDREKNILTNLETKRQQLNDSIYNYEQRVHSIIQIEKDIKAAACKEVEKAPDEYEFMVFDCETTGLSVSAYIIQLSWILLDKDFNILKEESYYIKPPTPIPAEATAINHITDAMVEEKATPRKDVLLKFHRDAIFSTRLVAHNFEFDASKVDKDTVRANIEAKSLFKHKFICTMEKGTKYCKIPGNYDGYKWPKLEELASYTGVRISSNSLHDSLYDCKVTARCLKVLSDEKFIRMKGINY